MRRASLGLLTLVSWALASSALARAPDTFEEEYAEPIAIDSPMWTAFELKIGPYQPDYRAFREIFGSDKGWLLSVEFDVTVYHIPYVGQLNVGAGWGWANYDARAAIRGGGSSGEKTELTFYPLSALAVLRIDALARHTVLPFTFAGKLGGDFVRWKATTGSNTDGSGLNMGLRWGAQAALELDFFDGRSARRLDDDWGINHTFLLLEFFESKTRGAGDRSFQFGLGFQY